MNYQYLTDAEDYDLEVLAHGVQLARKIVATSAMSKALGREVRDPSILHPQNSTEYAREYARKMASTIYHPAGTCRAGSPDDPRCVVDSQLRVIGLKGLRVADASVMPTITPGNTAAPSVMIGERCAAFVKAEWGL